MPLHAGARRGRSWLTAGFAAAACAVPAMTGAAEKPPPAPYCVDVITPENVKSLTGFTDAAMVRQGSALITQMNGSNGTPAAVLAIMQASEDTDVSYELLASKAFIESRMGVHDKPLHLDGRARGLFQFMPDTWLVVFKLYGDQYNKGQYTDLAAAITVRNYRPSVRDNAVKEQILALRSDPYVAAFIKAKYMKVVEEQEIRTITGREPLPVDYYFLHLLGTGRTETFFKNLRNTPNAAAARTFAKEARDNRGIFFQGASQQRTYREVYDHLSVIIGRYQERVTNPAPLTPLPQGCVTYLTYGQTPPPFAVMAVPVFPPPRPAVAENQAPPIP